MILGITGMPGSGKTEIAKLLEKKKFTTINMGDIVMKMAEENDIGMVNTKIREFATNMRKIHGNDFFAKETVKELKKVKSRNVAIVGVKSMYEIKIIKRQFRNLVMISIVAPKIVRFRRLKKRARVGDPKVMRDLAYRDKKEIGWGLSKIMHSADYVIMNTGTKADLKEGLDMVLKRLS